MVEAIPLFLLVHFGFRARENVVAVAVVAAAALTRLASVTLPGAFFFIPLRIG
jgi:hypothetical protein